MDLGLSGKVAVVTGASKGIGLAITRALVAEGVTVVAGARRTGGVAGLDGVHPVAVDLSAADGPARLVEEAVATFGGVDVLVNNAANDERHKLEDVTQEYWDNRIAINQRPSFFAVQAVAPGMIKKKAGSIINFSSISWHTSSGGFPVYTTAKSSVLGLTRGLARDLGAHNIRVNTVTPGWVMTERQIELWLDEKGKEDIKRNQCLQGELLPWHLARMVLFLASDESVMCTAQEFIVDAGWA